jgi:hypothetical protein
MRRNNGTLNEEGVMNMQTVAALAETISDGFQRTVPRQRAEYEILACLIGTDLVIDPGVRVPLNFGCRPEPPALWLDLEPRGAAIGVRLETTIEIFLKLLQGEFEARLLSRFGLGRIAQIGSKYGFEPSTPGVMTEFANLNVHENQEVAWAAAFSIVTPKELEALREAHGKIDVDVIVREASIPRPEAEMIVRMFEAHRHALLSPCLPPRWCAVHFAESESARVATHGC